MKTKADRKLVGDLPYRIRIGVTGDRVAVGNRESLAAAVQKILPAAVLDLFDPDSKRRLAEAKHTAIAYGVLTSLAGEGERLVAREILKRPGTRIELVIPRNMTSYLHGFTRPEERQEIESLCASARMPIVVPDPHPEAVGGSAATAVRSRAPSPVERFIVNNCDVLLAVVPQDDPRGGDLPAVVYAREKQRPLILIPAEPPHETAVERGNGLNARSIVRLDLFNRFAIREAVQTGYVRNAFRQLFDSDEGKQLPAAAKKSVQEVLLPYYVRASLLAKENQSRHRRAGQLVWGLFPVAIGAGALGTIVPACSPWAYGLELLILSAIAVTVFHADRCRSHEMWIENRFLAERLRAANYLAACGMEASPIRVPPYMGSPEQRDEWMVMAFDEIWHRLPALTGCSGDACRPIVAFIRKRWVQDQIGFHESKARTSRKMSRRLEKWGTIIFVLGLAAATVHLVHSLVARLEGEPEWMHPLTFLAIVLPGIGAALGGLRTHREYSRLAKRSHNMAQELHELDRSLAEAQDSESVSRALHDTEEFMLGEVQDWLMLMRFTPVVLP